MVLHLFGNNEVEFGLTLQKLRSDQAVQYSYSFSGRLLGLLMRRRKGCLSVESATHFSVFRSMGRRLGRLDCLVAEYRRCLYVPGGVKCPLTSTGITPYLCTIVRVGLSRSGYPTIGVRSAYIQ